MLVAIVSDIHGNRHAFETVLEAVGRADVAETWCLGDVVGYGADPDACVALAREHCDRWLAGNHDLAVTGGISIADFSRGAAAAARWTIEHIDPAAKEWLASLEASGSADGIGLYHGSPRDPVWEYVLSNAAADASMETAPERICCIGHSHVALAFHRPPGGRTAGAPREAGDAVDLRAGHWLLNPGSVGHPRDADPRAAWLLLDTEAGTAEWRREPYDIDGAAAAIRAAGLPESLAQRLSHGQ